MPHHVHGPPDYDVVMTEQVPGLNGPKMLGRHKPTAPYRATTRGPGGPKNGISRGFPGMTLKGTCKGTSSQVQVRYRSGPGQFQLRFDSVLFL